MLDVLRISALSAIAMVTALGIGPSLAGPDYSTPWYDQLPLHGTGPGLYYSYHPDHVPGYPGYLRGYPVPIYSTAHPTVLVPGVRYRSASAAHTAWCFDHWLTYRVLDNTYQPLYGPRRRCWSPFY